MRPLDITLLVLVQIIWGANYAVQKDAIAALPPLLLVGIGYLIISLALTPFTRRTHSPQWKLALLALFACTLPTGMTFFGLAHCPVSLGTLLMQMQVPFGIAVAWLLSRGKPDLRNIAGIAVALAGAAIVVGVPSFEGEVWGWVFVVIGSCVWTSCQAVLPMVTRDEGLRLYAGLSRHATPQVLIASLLFEAGHLDAIRNASPLAWGEVLFGALIGAVLCFSLWYKLIMRVPADKILPFLLLMPATGVIAGWLMLGEPLSAGLLIGGAIIIGGLAIILWPRKADVVPLATAMPEAIAPPEV
ncbi:MAG TPA: EamA family transporter [Dongiaceae bacterium]|nr:EamA family transporter [Dongiaceae bacterium]